MVENALQTRVLKLQGALENLNFTKAKEGEAEVREVDTI